MTENPTQPRDNAGRYAETERDVVDIDLTPVPQGSFLFPPIMTTRDEVVAFYEHVEIPDEVLMKIASNYVANRQELKPVNARIWWVENERSFRADYSGADVSDEARDAYVAKLEETWSSLPDYLDPRDARAAAKAIGIARAAQSISDAQEWTATWLHEVETTKGPASVHDLTRDWGLYRFSDIVTNPVAYDPEARMRELVAEMRQGFAADVEQVASRAAQEIAHVREAVSRQAAETRRHVDNSLNQTGQAIISAI